MKMLKPGPEIFLKAISETGLSSDELLFLDDSPRNTAGARAVGLRAIDFVQGSLLKDAIEPEL